MNDEDMLPCPFCGSDNVGLIVDGIGVAYIKCDNCYSTGGIHFIDQDIFGNYDDVENYKSEVIKYWNERTCACGEEND